MPSSFNLKIKGYVMDKGLKKFTKEMEKQLKANEKKGHWSKQEWGYLYNKILIKAHEVGVANTDKQTKKACVDLANYAMMLHDNCR